MFNRTYSKIKSPNKTYNFLFIFIAIGLFFRLINISWGQPYFFHPDERNIASSVTQLHFPDSLNPKFFAYGSLPIYSIYFTGYVINIINNQLTTIDIDVAHVLFENAIIIGRSFSLLFSILILYLIFRIANILGGKVNAFISTSLASLSVGYIQYAHFATFEMWLSFLILLLSYQCLLYLKYHHYRYFLYAGITTGMLISVKISSVVFLPAVFLILFFPNIKSLFTKKSFRKNLFTIEKFLFEALNFLGIVMITIYLTSPFFWFDNKGFLSSIRYESDVALGTIKVFYSQIFEDTIPFIYQFVKIYPFILNPIVGLISIAAIAYALFHAIRFKSKIITILLIFLSITFISQAFLFVKWVRYYIPTLSFIYLFVGFFVSSVFFGKSKLINRLGIVVVLTTLGISLLFSYSYFKTVLNSKDVRITAAEWASKKIPTDAKILSEVYDLGIVPFNKYFSKIELFNFYDLDTDESKNLELKNHLKETDYIILPSQRIFQTRTTNKKLYPLGSRFYANLFDGQLKFKKIYETPCDVFCKILFFNSPVYSYEQTANVFDRPTIYIFKKE